MTCSFVFVFVFCMDVWQRKNEMDGAEMSFKIDCKLDKRIIM